MCRQMVRPLDLPSSFCSSTSFICWSLLTPSPYSSSSSSFCKEVAMAAAAQAAASAALSAPDSVQVQQKKPKKQHLHLHRHRHRHRLSMPCSSFLAPRFSRGLSIRPHPQENHGSRPALWISPVSEIAVDGSANAAAVVTPKLDTKSEEDTPEEPPAAIAKEATISAVMADVANLVKLVDSRDIVELELKHLDYELVIRKKEALLPSPAAPALAPPQIVAQAPYPAYAPPPPPAAAVPAPSPAPAASSPPAPAALPASDLQRILSPMAGTFYKCPAPGEPQLVKVGDKVTKGQVICIVEAMKLMNEIEADQTGTVVEILAEDGKPVAVDTPLFAIKP